MKHYTYMITVNNPTDSRRLYIGVRSCHCEPEEDVYFGSCRSFKAWQKIHGVDGLIKEVLATWPTRADAVSHEILLHNCFNVGSNTEFWNNAKQTAVGFDTTGTTHVGYNKGMKWTNEQRQRLSELRKGHPTSEETKQKISMAQKGREMPEERRLLLVGKKASDEARQKMREAKLGKSSWSLGKKFTEEHRQKLSLARLGKSPWNKGRQWSDEERSALSEAARNRKVVRERNEKGQYL